MDRYFLFNLFRKHGVERGERHYYDYMYAALFTEKGDPTSLLEIGFKRGRGLACWKDCFPSAKIEGVNSIKPTNELIQIKDIQRYYGDPSSEYIRNLVSGYDYVVDAESTRADTQWSVFLNMRTKWNKAYIIENIYGIEGDKILRKRLRDHGYTNVVTYSSAIKDLKVQTNSSGVVSVDMYAMVIYPR